METTMVVERGAKTWGPFTGRQLTVMFCVTVVMMLLPVGAWAVAGSNAFVTDPVSGKQATVNATKQLEVHTNGSVDKIAGSVTNNRAEVTKGNQLQVTEAPPSSYASGFGAVFAGQRAGVIAPPAGKAVIVKQVHVATYFVATGDPYVQLYVGDSTCQLVNFITDYDVPETVHTVFTLPFEPGIVVPNGFTLCAFGSSTSADVVAFGYLVPAAAVTAPAYRPAPPKR